MDEVLDGGCLCGAIRYRVTGPVANAGICHCRTCRKSASAPFLPFATFPVAAFQITLGSPAEFRSSSLVTRSFCGRCGSSLTYRHDGKPDKLDIMICSLDDPDQLPPSFHVWTNQKLAWTALDDGLPTFETSRPDC